LRAVKIGRSTPTAVGEKQHNSNTAFGNSDPPLPFCRPAWVCWMLDLLNLFVFILKGKRVWECIVVRILA